MECVCWVFRWDDFFYYGGNGCEFRFFEYDFVLICSKVLGEGFECFLMVVLLGFYIIGKVLCFIFDDCV